MREEGVVTLDRSSKQTGGNSQRAPNQTPYSLVPAPHVPQVEPAARPVAKHHDAHAVGHGVAGQALKPGERGARSIDWVGWRLVEHPIMTPPKKLAPATSCPLPPQKKQPEKSEAHVVPSSYTYDAHLSASPGNGAKGWLECRSEYCGLMGSSCLRPRPAPTYSGSHSDSVLSSSDSNSSGVGGEGLGGRGWGGGVGGEGLGGSGGLLEG
jgi:hypothetical protein